MMLRVWKSDGPRPCKRCKTAINKGDSWASKCEGWSRLCAQCWSSVTSDRAHMTGKAEAEQRHAVRQARREGTVL